MPRKGFLTASSFDSLMSGFSKGVNNFDGKTASDIVMQLAADWLGHDMEGYEDEATGARAWGNEYECLARDAYSEQMVTEVKQASFTIANDASYVGGTMDGLVGDDGGIEIKCPYNSVNHLDRESQRKKYKYQLQGYMWIFDLNWIDFISYDPRFPENLQLIVERVVRNESTIDDLRTRCAASFILAKSRALDFLGDPARLSEILIQFYGN